MQPHARQCGHEGRNAEKEKKKEKKERKNLLRRGVGECHTRHTAGAHTERDWTGLHSIFGDHIDQAVEAGRVYLVGHGRTGTQRQTTKHSGDP